MKILKKGFTLAEVLITLTIIGVVAAITLPGLQNNVNKQSLEKQTLKVYNTIVEAHDRYLADNFLKQADSDFISPTNIRRYFNVIAQSPNGNFTGFFANQYTNVNGDQTFSISDYPTGNIAYKLADETVFTVNLDGGNDDIIFIVDVNGTKGPNVNGYDMWEIVYDIDPGATGRAIEPDQVVGYSAGIDAGGGDSYSNDIFNACIDGSNVYGCFGHFMRNGFKFDY